MVSIPQPSPFPKEKTLNCWALFHFLVVVEDVSFDVRVRYRKRHILSFQPSWTSQGVATFLWVNIVLRTPQISTIHLTTFIQKCIYFSCSFLKTANFLFFFLPHISQYILFLYFSIESVTLKLLKTRWTLHYGTSLILMVGFLFLLMIHIY